MLGIEASRMPSAVLAVGAVAAVVFVVSPTDSGIQIVAWFVPLVMAVMLIGWRWRSSAPSMRKPESDPARGHRTDRDLAA